MYSGDEFYGEDVTSPTERPIDKWMRKHNIPAAKPDPAFDAWLARLDKIIWRKVGCSLDDLEDYNTHDAWSDGLTPMQFYRETIAPDVEE